MIKKTVNKILRKGEKADDEEVLRKNRNDIAKALEILFADGYIDKKKLYFENFLRGIFFSAGGIIGATIVIALLLWILSLFDQIPLIGPLIEGLSKTIEEGSSSVR